MLHVGVVSENGNKALAYDFRFLRRPQNDQFRHARVYKNLKFNEKMRIFGQILIYSTTPRREKTAISDRRKK
ncbi:hypothetical protein NSMM_470047 [Nitrosomonas mobilis]|uniref:Uncharacterized protein n=1 Tax=Nitrosomonas mobilis TaxID=51642 RepID=A0A1G5SFS3_9PROT|nr:hypothetical protein NSMM_470047 [Nitrosomonas mobilis]